MSKLGSRSWTTLFLVLYLLSSVLSTGNSNGLLYIAACDKLNSMVLESSKHHYNWKAGVRIRGNLDIIEAWAMDSGYGAQSIALLATVSALANLLGTPTDQLFKVCG